MSGKKIGQLIYSVNKNNYNYTDFLTDCVSSYKYEKSNEIALTDIEQEDNRNYYDLTFTIPEGGFKKDIPYYIKADIDLSDILDKEGHSSRIIGIYFYTKSNDQINYQKIKEVTIQDNLSISFVATPKRAYKSIVFKLFRTADDQNISKKDYKEDVSNLPVAFDGYVIKPKNYQISQIVNLFDKNNKITAMRLAVQSNPGTMMQINGEQIVIGKNGFYELFNEEESFSVNNLGFVVDKNEQNKTIIVDYQYI